MESMIGRLHRFHGFASLRYVYHSGRTVRGPLFAVKAVLNERRRNYRVAVVVSRKVHRSAVARNRIRRRLYEAVRAIEKDILGPYDIVLTVFSGSAVTEPAKNLQDQVKKQFSEVGIIA